MGPAGALLLLAVATAEAQIYRCETAQGPVFTDSPCGAQAEVVTLADESSGISLGPSEEVRDYLDSQRAERAAEREERQRMPPAQAAAPVGPVENRSYGYPVYWPRNHRPNRPNRPRPERPIAPPPPDIPDSGSVLRPRNQGG